MTSEKLDHYLRHAEDAEAMIDRCTTEAERNTWREVALLWRDLAERKRAAAQGAGRCEIAA